MFKTFILLLSICFLLKKTTCLTGEKTISGSNSHDTGDDHHLDQEGNLIHKRVVRKDNFLFVTLRNLDIAIRKTEYFVLFVYGDWCQFSKQHLEVFKKFATFHKRIHSKLLFGSLHIAKKEQFTYAEVVSNPTIFLYHHGSLVRKFDFLKNKIKILDLRPKILISFEPFLLSNISDRKHVQNLMESFNRFLIYVSDKHVPTVDLENALKLKDEAWDAPELNVIGIKGQNVSTDTGLTGPPDRQTKVLANFLKMSDMKIDSNLKYFNLSSVTALQEFFPEHKIIPGHVYLFRKKDHSLLRMENVELGSMNNWFDAKSWIYHHLHPDVLPFPEPAKKRIIDDHNMAVFLFLHGQEEISKEPGKLSKNEKAEAELDLIAKANYK